MAGYGPSGAPEPRRDIINMQVKSDDSSRPLLKVKVRTECFTADRGDRLGPARLFENRLRLCAHRAQVARIAMGRRRLVRRVVCVPGSRDRWLYTGVTRAAKKLTVVV